MVLTGYAYACYLVLRSIDHRVVSWVADPAIRKIIGPKKSAPILARVPKTPVKHACEGFALFDPPVYFAVVQKTLKKKMCYPRRGRVVVAILTTAMDLSAERLASVAKTRYRACGYYAVYYMALFSGARPRDCARGNTPGEGRGTRPRRKRSRERLLGLRSGFNGLLVWGREGTLQFRISLSLVWSPRGILYSTNY